MDEKDLPTTNLIDIDTDEIKKQLLYSNSWTKIEEIRNYCNELLVWSDETQPLTKNEIIQKVIYELETMKD